MLWLRESKIGNLDAVLGIGHDISRLNVAVDYTLCMSMGEAIALLKRALAIDPSYSPAAAMIGWCRPVSFSLARMAAVASKPSISGISTSISTTS